MHRADGKRSGLQACAHTGTRPRPQRGRRLTRTVAHNVVRLGQGLGVCGARGAARRAVSRPRARMHGARGRRAACWWARLAAAPRQLVCSPRLQRPPPHCGGRTRRRPREPPAPFYRRRACARAPHLAPRAAHRLFVGDAAEQHDRHRHHQHGHELAGGGHGEELGGRGGGCGRVGGVSGGGERWGQQTRCGLRLVRIGRDRLYYDRVG